MGIFSVRAPVISVWLGNAMLKFRFSELICFRGKNETSTGAYRVSLLNRLVTILAALGLH